MTKTFTLAAIALLLVPLALVAPTAAAARPSDLTSVTVSPSAISPGNADGVSDTLTISVAAATGQTLFANIYDNADQLRRTAVPLVEVAPGAYSGVWDARVNGGALATAGGSPYVVKVTPNTLGDRLDEAGPSATFDLDDAAPSGVTLAINGGARFATSASRGVTLTIGATAPTTGYQMRVAQGASDAALAGVAWTPFLVSQPFTLSVGEGAKTLRLQVRDAAGNAAPTVTASITLDLTDPSGSVSIDGGAATTSTTSVTLGIAAADANGVTQMRISNDGGSTFPNGWESYAGTKAWRIPGTGTRTVLVEFRDGAGRTSSATDSINVVPALVGQAVEIAAGATYTTAASGVVTLTLTNPDPATYTRMAFSNSGLPGSFSAPEAFVATKTWTLADPTADGIKSVFFQLRTPGDVTSVASDTIIRDTTPPTATTAAQDAVGLPVTLTRASGVILALGGDDTNGLAGARLGTDEATLSTRPTRDIPRGGTLVWCFADSDPLAVSRAGTADCPVATDGTKAIFVQTIDRAGLASTARSVRIDRDTVAPTLASVAIGGLVDGRTSSETLAVTLAFAGDATQTAFSFDGGAFGAWRVAATTTSVELPVGARGEGAHTLTARVRDAAGNIATSAPVLFTRDASGPIGSLELVAEGSGDPATTTARAVTLRISASDATHMRVWEGDVEPTTSEPFAASKSITLSSTLGTKIVRVRLFDLLGNPSVVLSRTVALVTPPITTQLPVVTIEPKTWTTSRDVTIVVDPAPTATDVAIAEDRSPSSGFAPLANGRTQFRLSDRDGLHQVHVSLRSAGVTDDYAPIAIQLDRAAPQTRAPDAIGAWQRGDVTFQLEATDATSGVQATTWDVDGGAQQSGAVVRVSGDGVHTVRFRSTDVAGNVEPERTIEVRVDATTPTTTTDLADGLTTSRDFVLNLRASDAGSGVAAVRYRLVAPGISTEFITLRQAPFSIPLFRTLGDGGYAIEYSAIDVAGNEEPTKTFGFTFAPQAPAVPLPAAPPAPDAGAKQTARPAATDPLTITFAGEGPLVAANLRSDGPIAGVLLESTVLPPFALPYPGLRVWTHLDIQPTAATPAARLTGLGADLRFNLTRAWLANQSLEPGQILLLHETGSGWDVISTTVVAQDPALLGFAGNVTFEARVPGFSRFAIAGDNTPPSFANPAPANGATAEPALGQIDVGLSDNVGIASYVVLLDDLDVTSASSLQNGLLIVDVSKIGGGSLEPGVRHVEARAKDLAGNDAVVRWQFEVVDVPLESTCAPTETDGRWLVCLPLAADLSTVRVRVNDVTDLRAEDIDIRTAALRHELLLDLTRFPDAEVVVFYNDGKSDTTQSFSTRTFEPESEAGGGTSTLGIILFVVALAAVTGLATAYVMQRRRPKS